MKRTHLIVTLSIVALLSIGIAFPPPAAVKTCGAERWPVKVGKDPHVKFLFKNNSISSGKLKRAKKAEIADLIDEEYPFGDINANPPQWSYFNRASIVEDTIYKVEGKLTDYKKETGATGDSDYHLVIEDESGNTIIAEIPNPPCLSQTPEPLKGLIMQAKSDFDSRLTVTGSFQTANVKVRITGPGFFDRSHGQRGYAPNGFEIHPVIKIEFLE